MDTRKIQLLQVKHVEDVIESKEELFRGECVDVQPLLPHDNHVQGFSLSTAHRHEVPLDH